MIKIRKNNMFFLLFFIFVVQFSFNNHAYAWTTSEGMFADTYNGVMRTFWAEEEESPYSSNTSYYSTSMDENNSEITGYEPIDYYEITDASGIALSLNNMGAFPGMNHKKSNKSQNGGVNFLTNDTDPLVHIDTSYDFFTPDFSGENSFKILAFQNEYNEILGRNTSDDQDNNYLSKPINEIMSEIVDDSMTPESQGFAAMAGLGILGGIAATGSLLSQNSNNEEESEESEENNNSNYSLSEDQKKAMIASINNIPNLSSYVDGKVLKTIENWITDINGDYSGQTLQNLASNIAYYAKEYNVDPLVITALLTQESGFNASAVSSCGALGIAQFMPETAAGFGIDATSVPDSIKGCCQYVSGLMESFNDYSLALAGYNAGGGAVQKYGGIPPYSETINYVSSITNMWAELNAKYQKITTV